MPSITDLPDALDFVTIGRTAQPDESAASRTARVLVVTSSCRRGSTTERVGSMFASALEAVPFVVDLVHVGELDLPSCTGAADQLQLGPVRNWRERVRSVDCCVWVSAEWHGSIAGSFKNALDLLTEQDVSGKILALAAQAGGGLGAVSALAHMRVIAQHFGAWVLPTQLSVHPSDLEVPFDTGILERMQRMARELHDGVSVRVAH